MRYHSPKSVDEQISFREYVDRMKEGQNDIYYITGESIAAVSSWPFLEFLRKKGIVVLYMVDPIWWVCSATAEGVRRKEAEVNYQGGP